jgi:hypothetical protein
MRSPCLHAAREVPCPQRLPVQALRGQHVTTALRAKQREAVQQNSSIQCIPVWPLVGLDDQCSGVGQRLPPRRDHYSNACHIDLLLKATTEARDKDTFQRWVIEPLFGLFAGWLTLAAFLNAGSAVRDKFGTTDDAQLRCRLKNRRGLLSKRKSTHLVWRCFSGREGAFRSS